MKSDGKSQEILIRERLIERGRRLFDASRNFIEFTGQREADELPNDLEQYPHAFVIACVMDRQVPAERAWLIPYKLSLKLGNFHFSTLRLLSEREICNLMLNPEPLHRFPEEMARNLYRAVRVIEKEYGSDASKIWEGRPSSAEVVYRFLQFRGVGPKIATMAVNILARDFKIPFSDYYSIDISADVHVRRVFHRLGLVTEKPTVEGVIYRARSLYPEFPGLLDLPCWEIGRNWCKPRGPACDGCYMNDLCPFGKDWQRQ